MKLLNVKEAADFLNISKVTLYRMTSKKQISHYKVGAKMLFDKEKLIEWISNLEVVPAN